MSCYFLQPEVRSTVGQPIVSALVGLTAGIMNNINAQNITHNSTDGPL